MRDVDGVNSNPVIKAVCLCYGTVFIEKERIRNRILFQVLFRLEKTGPPLRGQIRKLCPNFFNLSDQWLELGHALNAVRSPSASQEFHDQRSLFHQVGE